MEGGVGDVLQDAVDPAGVEAAVVVVKWRNGR
jgi:hypothetical protein